ncbi:hypothetical protein QL285_081999 [Trifolium repens]|nr:hypothetical protein QL285_081999 [Trifolium repens]
MGLLKRLDVMTIICFLSYYMSLVRTEEPLYVEPQTVLLLCNLIGLKIRRYSKEFSYRFEPVVSCGFDVSRKIRRSRHRKFLIGNVLSPPLFSILAPILLPSFTVLPVVSIFDLPYEFLQSIFDAILMRFTQNKVQSDRLAFREKWKTDIKFGSVYVLFCISSSTILVIDIEFLELQARDTLQNICTGPISNASFVRLSISVKV